MSDLSEFSIVNDDGYPQLVHVTGEDSEHGCFVMFVDPGDRLDGLVHAAEVHQCGES